LDELDLGGEGGWKDVGKPSRRDPMNEAGFQLIYWVFRRDSRRDRKGKYCARVSDGARMRVVIIVLGYD
jgi:hypothetical protein